MNNITLDPLCFKTLPLAITNTGYLLPCCYCDDPSTLNDPEFKKLLNVSKIDDYSSLEEIINTKEWKRFYKNLLKNKGPDTCIHTCQVRTNKNDIIRKDTHIDPSSRKIINIRNV